MNRTITFIMLGMFGVSSIAATNMPQSKIKKIEPLGSAK